MEPLLSRLNFGEVIYSILGALLILCTPTSSYAQWAEVEGWLIDTHDSGCMLMAEFEGDVLFSIRLDGFSSKDMEMDIILASSNWSSIRPRSNYEVRMDFNRGTNWNVDFRGIQLGESAKGLLNSSDAYSEDSGIFAEDFMRSDTVYIAFEGKRVANLNLKGSRAAFEEMVECQKSFIAGVGSQDPFSGTDPFR